VGYEAVGELDPRLETVAKWNEQFREGVVYYLRDGPVRGSAAVERMGKGRRRQEANRGRQSFYTGGIGPGNRSHGIIDRKKTLPISMNHSEPE